MVARGLVAFSLTGITMRSAFNLGSIPSPGRQSRVGGLNPLLEISFCRFGRRVVLPVLTTRARRGVVVGAEEGVAQSFGTVL